MCIQYEGKNEGNKQEWKQSKNGERGADKTGANGVMSTRPAWCCGAPDVTGAWELSRSNKENQRFLSG